MIIIEDIDKELCKEIITDLPEYFGLPEYNELCTIDILEDLVVNNYANTFNIETLSPSENDENYLETYQFYKSIDFVPLFDLKPNGYEWNMLYMIKISS